MKATNDFIEVKETTGTGIQVPGSNLKLGEVISIGERCKSEPQFPGDTNETRVCFKEGDKVLFDTNKSLKYGEFWYLKGNSVFAYDENK